MDYKQAGVDIEKGDRFVSSIKDLVGQTHTAAVRSDLRGFSAVYDLGGGQLLTAATDGVGTKLMLAVKTQQHSTIGQDLVAMCANDLICNGSRALFFLDYLATGALDEHAMHDVVAGIARACSEAGMALVGGETAEMPGMYEPGHYDLAGFAVGSVAEGDLIDGRDVTPGDTLIGLPSSGFHSNGYSLVRALIGDDEIDLMRAALEPTRLYVGPILHLLTSHRNSVHGMAHITGGGLHNVTRMNPNCDYVVDHLPDQDALPSPMHEVLKRAELTREQAAETFNCGVGFVIATPDPDAVVAALTQAGETPLLMGRVEAGSGRLHLRAGSPHLRAGS
jgi:phosphoribosylformylglycinamidine cyclo-ligase